MVLKITKHEITLVEAYLVAFAATAFGLYSSGDHQIKKVAWSALIAVLAPVYLKVKAYLAKKAVAVPVATK